MWLVFGNFLNFWKFSVAGCNFPVICGQFFIMMDSVYNYCICLEWRLEIFRNGVNLVEMKWNSHSESKEEICGILVNSAFLTEFRFGFKENSYGFCLWQSDWKQTNKWINRQISEQVNKWTSERTGKVLMNEWVNEWMTVQMATEL